MTTLTRRAALASLGLAVSGALGGCGRRRAVPGEVVVLVNAEPGHLDPRYPGDALGATLSRLVFASLLDSDPITFEPRLALAESVTPVGEHVVRATLRDGLRFHDGSPLTARDVEATYRAALDPALRSTLRGTYDEVFASVRALDGRTVEFELRGPDGAYPSFLQLSIMRAADCAHGEIPAMSGNESRFVGSGQFRVRSLETGQWAFERVAASHGTARSLRFLTMHDPNTLALRLLHADADTAEIKPELFSVFLGRPGFHVRSAPSVGVTYVGIRNDQHFLSSRKARQAIALAIDRHGLRVGKFGRFAVDATGLLPPSHWAYAGDVARHPYDPALARRLLDGIARPSGPLLLRVSNVRFVVTVANAIAEMLRAVGLDVDVRQSDLASLLADLRAGRYDLTVLTMPDLSDPWGLGWLLGSRAMPTADNPRAGGNRWRYRNPRLDRVLDDARAALGNDARKPFYAEAQRIIADDLPVVPLWHADLVFAAGSRLGAFRPRGDGQWDFLADATFVG